MTISLVAWLKTMQIHCYSLQAIDVWAGCVPWEAVTPPSATFLEDCKAIALRDLGWQGDIRQGPFAFTVLDVPYGDVGVAWKQDKKGQTFVFSPRPLDWLKDRADRFVIRTVR